jgi:hypothetical protein
MPHLAVKEQIGERQIRVSSKKWPRKTGAKSGRNNWGSTRSRRAVLPLWRARRGLRAQDREDHHCGSRGWAWAINKRSMVAIMRPNSEAEGIKPREAVLDILSPNSGTADRCSSYRSNLGMPDARCNSFVCIAAYYILQCSMEGADGTRPHRKSFGKSQESPAEFNRLPLCGDAP